MRRACYRRNRSTLPQPRSHGSPLGASLRQPPAQPDDRPVAIWQAWTPQLPPLPAPPGHACSWLQLNYTVHAGSADGSIEEMSASNPAFANLPFKHPVEPLQCCFAAFGSSADASVPCCQCDALRPCACATLRLGLQSAMIASCLIASAPPLLLRHPNLRRRSVRSPACGLLKTNARSLRH